jgi:hypothetical protein
MEREASPGEVFLSDRMVILLTTWRSMRMVPQLLFVILYPVFCASSAEVTGESRAGTVSLLHYDIIRKGELIGYIDSKKTIMENQTEYQMESSVTTSLIMDFTIYSLVRGIFSQGHLV